MPTDMILIVLLRRFVLNLFRKKWLLWFSSPKLIILTEFCVFCSHPWHHPPLQLSNYPPICVRADGGGQLFQSKSNLDRPILMMPQNESLAKRLTRIYHEEGTIEALKQAELHTQGQPINHILRGLYFGLTKLKEVNRFLWPYTNNQNVQSLGDFSQTR